MSRNGTIGILASAPTRNAATVGQAGAPALQGIAHLAPGPALAKAEQDRRQRRENGHGQQRRRAVSAEQETISLVQIDGKPRAPPEIDGVPGAGALLVNDDAMGREAQAHSLLEPSQAPLHFFAVQEIVLAHRPGGLNELAADE